jgi:hypothetical protein
VIALERLLERGHAAFRYAQIPNRVAKHQQQIEPALREVDELLLLPY